MDCVNIKKSFLSAAVVSSLAVAASVPALAKTQVSLTQYEAPIGVCDSITPGAIGYRNLTGRTPNAVEKIGRSAQGRDIYAEHWGPTAGRQVLVIGQTHGDECSPAFFVEQVRLKDPVGYGIWLIPTLNPDGSIAHTRSNANNVNINRDGFARTQPETRALLKFTKKVNPVLSIHLHSPYAWVGWYNGTLAFNVAKRMGDVTNWGYPPNAGEKRDGVQAFLWQGQARVLPGHQSVLIELPAISKKEATKAPRKEDTKYASVDATRRMAVALRKALDKEMSNK